MIFLLWEWKWAWACGCFIFKHRSLELDVRRNQQQAVQGDKERCGEGRPVVPLHSDFTSHNPFFILEFWAYISHYLLFQRILFINHNSLLRTFSLYLRMLLCFLTIASLYLVIIYIAQLWVFSHNSGRTFHNSDLFPHNCNSSLNSDFLLRIMRKSLNCEI